MNRMGMSPEWFDAYVAAMLEVDQCKVAERVHNAQGAIESRLAKIARGETLHGREQIELNDALKYLRMLSALNDA
jgi:hypothetical protein